MADIFRRTDAVDLLTDQRILMFGDSNMRSVYRDLIYLLVEGGVAPPEKLRRSKNELAGHCGDKVVESSGVNSAGRHYEEVRQYEHKKLFVHYRFITKVYSSSICKDLQAIEDGKLPKPKIVIMNSCIWDLTRWGANQEDQYKENMVSLFSHLRRILPADTLFIWLTTLPVSTMKIRGGVLIKQLEFVQHSMEFIVMEANKFAHELCKAFNFNLLDLHYYMRFHLQKRTKDGLHWEPPAVRMMTNSILTHIALNFGKKLPGNGEVCILRDLQDMAEEAKKNKQESIDDLLIDQNIKDKIVSALSGKLEKGKIENRVKSQAKRNFNSNVPKKTSVFDRRPSPTKNTYVRKLASYYNQQITKSLDNLFGSRNYHGMAGRPSHSRNACYFQNEFCQEQHQGTPYFSGYANAEQTYYGGNSQWGPNFYNFSQGTNPYWNRQQPGYQPLFPHQQHYQANNPNQYSGYSYWNQVPPQTSQRHPNFNAYYSKR